MLTHSLESVCTCGEGRLSEELRRETALATSVCLKRLYAIIGWHRVCVCRSFQLETIVSSTLPGPCAPQQRLVRGPAPLHRLTCPLYSPGLAVPGQCPVPRPLGRPAPGTPPRVEEGSTATQEPAPSAQCCGHMSHSFPRLSPPVWPMAR